MCARERERERETEFDERFFIFADASEEWTHRALHTRDRSWP